MENVFDDIDVFNSDENNLNTSRLSASTIEQLFEDTKYNLQKVKETKLVNIGNSIDHLPKEMKKIESTKKRKNLLIRPSVANISNIYVICSSSHCSCIVVL